MTLEAAIMASGLDYKKIADDVFLIENFILEEEYYELIDFANTSDWEEEGLKELKEIALEKFGTDNVKKLLAEKKLYKQPMFDKIIMTKNRVDACKKMFERLKKLTPQGTAPKTFDVIQKHTAGSGLAPHVDEVDGLDVIYGAIAYLKHANSGGEIYFHPLDLSVLPPERSLLVFSSAYLHEVLPVTGSGVRLAAPSYFYAENSRTP